MSGRRPSADADPPIIELKGVEKRYPDGTVALRDIDLTVEAGALCFITGPSGAGKSTLLKLVHCAELASSGNVQVGGNDPARLKPRSIPFLRRNIGVVFQDFKLLPARTVAENVGMALEVVGESPRTIRTRVKQVLSQVGLGGRGHLRPGSLSGGEQQRVAVARAIINEPAIVLADEPTGNLDPALSREILDLLVRIHRKGTTLLVATHDPELLTRAPSARLLHLVDGRITRDLPVETGPAEASD